MRAMLFVGQEHSETYLDELLAYCQSRRYEVVGVVHTLTGAEQMFAAGEADVLVMTSCRALRMRWEVISEETSRPPPRLPTQRPRPRRLQ